MARPLRRRGTPRPEGLDAALARALAEDRVDRDLTSLAVIPAGWRGRARVEAQGAGVLSGGAVAARLARRTGLAVRRRRPDGARLRRGTVVLELSGNLRRILGVERTLLNYLMHLSGVATETRRAVTAARGRAAILATRKTLPGLRELEKAAVVDGGGSPHRRDLAAAILVKSTHTALVGVGTAVRAAVARARGAVPVEVEVRSVSEALEAIDAGARRLLLDNRPPAEARRLIAALTRRGLRRSVSVELSGGITSKNVARYAATGADALSLGSLTHSAPALPFHLVLLGRPTRPPAR